VTPFAWWAARWRLEPLWLLGAICLLAGLLARRRARNQHLKPLA
jgi:apolipoprotein N-acyltransferase